MVKLNSAARKYPPQQARDGLADVHAGLGALVVLAPNLRSLGQRNLLTRPHVQPGKDAVDQRDKVLACSSVKERRGRRRMARSWLAGWCIIISD